ncbi:446_t:CDS:1, partial [Dentiscutata heterogama]
EAKLPIHPSETGNLLEGTIIQQIYELENDLPMAQNQTMEHIKAQQQKQKDRHDRQIKATPDFNIEDKVYVEDTRKMKTHSHKMIPQWKGPYYIHSIIGNGAYKLRTAMGKVLLHTVNKTLLKAHYERNI